MSARTLALRVLRSRFGEAGVSPIGEPGLVDFQRDAVERLETALERYRGAILADSVGLGKTHIGAAIGRRMLARGSPVILATPPALRPQWRRTIRDRRVLIVSHAALSRGAAVTVPAGDGPALIVVDEAHSFRNPLTRRYRALAALATGARLLLITATPVNNSLRDLYWLLRLFAGDGTFIDVGVPDLQSCFRQAERSGGPGRIPTILDRVMVRRTRSLLVAVHGRLDFGAGELGFPDREPPRPVRYRRPAAWRRVLSTIEALELNAWTETRGADLLLRMTLLRRTESSAAAAIASFAALESAIARALVAVDRGLDPRDSLRARHPASEQLAMDTLLLGTLPRGFDRAAFEQAARRDQARIADVLAIVRAAPDAKLEALIGLLARLRGRPVVLFTEFRTTALQLHRDLRDRFRTGLVHGGGALLGNAPAARRTVIERFAPEANGARTPPPRECIELLITTDVLAEGLNLHDAADVISYDLPWNPVRLIQRVGRIDRLGSRHERIRSHHFVPERDLERILGVMRRLRRKLRAIDCTIGIDDQVLGNSRDLAGALRGDAAAFENIERHDALTCDIEERLRAAYRQARDRDAADLPLFPGTRDAAAADAGPTLARMSARVPVPSALARARGPLLCVFLSGARGPRAMVWRGRVAVADDRFTGSALMAALETPEIEPLTSRHTRLARLAAAKTAAVPDLPAPRVAAAIPRLRRRLYQLLERLPGGATAFDCERVERVIAALQDAPAGVELELRRRRAQLRTLPLDGLCGAIEAMLGQRLPPFPARSPTATRDARTRVLGVLLTDPSSG